jgi:uncharacterized repeat protein (TIGR01451 family)
MKNIVAMKKIALAACFVFLTLGSFSRIEAQSYGGAYAVDGTYSEWNLTNDFYSDMYRAFRTDKPVESKLYLHYDCQNKVMYALVLVTGNVIGLKQVSDAWIAIDGISNKVVSGSTGDNGTAPDFSWVSIGYDGNTNHVMGYEASFPLTEASHRIIAHIEVFDDGEAQTSGTVKDNDGLVLNPSCPSIPTLDLSVTKTVDDNTPALGQVVSFTITVSNLSATVNATQVILTDVLPAGLSFVSAVPSAGTFNSTTKVWAIPVLNAASSATLTMNTTVNYTIPLCNQISLTGLDQIDSNSSNNTAESCVDVQDLDLEVHKIVDNSQPNLNDNVTFTVIVKNLSATLSATNVVITDQLPPGLEYVSSTASSGTYNQVTGLWTIPALAAGASATLAIVVKVTTADPVCNHAALTDLDQEDTMIKNDEDEACVDGKVVELDLGVAKSVYNAVPKTGENSVFTISVTNNSTVETATHIILSDILNSNFLYQSHTQSTGTYSESTGNWSIATLAPAASATLTITVKVNGSADNTVCLTSLDQEDTNPANDCASVSVTVSGSSGGNNGGLESNGDLAGLIALRNYNRNRTGSDQTFETPGSMVTYSPELADQGIIRPVSILKGQSSLMSYLPATGPFKSKAFVSTPDDLLEISNAREVISLDYFNEESQRYGAVLALTTEHGDVYNHTKLICDRLMGARMELAMNIQIDNKPFILTKLVQENGDIDYAVTFVAWTKGNGLTVDSKWHNEEYAPESGAIVYNFQVWSVTIQSTVELVEDILTRMEVEGAVKYMNTQPRSIPQVRVISGAYRNGSLFLQIANKNGASEITVKGTLTRTELSDRENFTQTVAIRSDLEIQEIAVPVGTIYDAGISVGNNLNSFRDALYFADGSWGLDYTADGAIVTGYTLSGNENVVNGDDLYLERNVSFTGEIKDYVSIFRGLKAGSRPVDLTGYNTLQFDASGTGSLEVVITKSSVEGWSKQYRTRVALESGEKSYFISLANLSSQGSMASFSGEDTESVVFSLIGNGSDWNAVSLDLKNVKFTTVQPDFNTLSMEDFRLTSYPNPFRAEAQISFELPEKGQVLLTVLDGTGRQIDVLANQEMSQGQHTWNWNASSLNSGIYLLKMNYNNQQVVRRLIKE